MIIIPHNNALLIVFTIPHLLIQLLSHAEIAPAVL